MPATKSCQCASYVQPPGVVKIVRAVKGAEPCSDKLFMTEPVCFPEQYYGSRGRRLGGYIADRLAIFGVQCAGGLLGAFVAALMVGNVPEKVSERAVSIGMLLGWFFWGLAAWFLNYGILQGKMGGTIGKLIFGLRLLNADGSPVGIVKSMGRTVAYLVSSLPVFVGFAAIFWDDRRQCWHDLVCSTIVVRKDAALPAIDMDRQQLSLFTDTPGPDEFEFKRAA